MTYCIGTQPILYKKCKRNLTWRVFSNFLAYDTEGNVTGIAGDMVHIFNKNESAVHDSPYFKKLEGRKNIVLMGDSLGDLQVTMT